MAGFSTDSEVLRSTDGALMTGGILGRGEVTSAQETRTPPGQGATDQVVVVYDVHVTIDDHPSYRAQVRQMVPIWQAALLVPGTVVAVRIDPQDRSHIALELPRPSG